MKNAKFSKLRGKITEEFGSGEAFADEIGVTRQTISHKVTGKVQFRLDEVKKWSDALHIKPEEIADFFMLN